MLPRWQGRRPEAPPSHRDQRLAGYPRTPAAGERCGPREKHPQPTGTKTLRITARKGKEELLPSACITHPRNWHCSMPTTQRAWVFPSGKEEGWATSCPSFRSTPRRSCFRCDPTQKLAKLSGVEMAAMEWEWPQVPVPFFITPAAFT